VRLLLKCDGVIAEHLCPLEWPGRHRVSKDGLGLALSVTDASRAIIAAAGRLHFRLTDHATVLARAKAAGVSLEGKLAIAQDAGQLRDFNRRYQQRRLAAKLAVLPICFLARP
jgi:hypothetical protein